MSKPTDISQAMLVKDGSIQASSTAPSTEFPTEKEEPSEDIAITSVEVASIHVHESDLPTWKLFVIIGGLCLGLFMALMDMSIISTALYTISVDFKDYRHTVWAALAYTLADVGCAVFFTRLADVFGRKQMILSSFSFFTCFSLACGFARNSSQLIIFRTLQGIGGTGLYSLTMVICPEISPPRFLPLVVGAIGCTVAVAGVCGPVLGGIITGTTTWRWIFWLNVPIGVVAIVILYFVWPSKKNITDIADSSSFKQLDFFGATLNAISSICFVFVLQEGGTREFPFGSPVSATLLALSGTATIAFYLWQKYISQGKIATWILPQLPWRIITHRPMSMAILSTILAGYVQFTAVFSIPLRAQIVDLNSPVRSGLRLLPLVAATAFGSLIGAGASAKRNVTFYTMTIASVLMIIGTGLLSNLPSDGHQTKAQYGFEVILGLGLGMTVSTATFMTSLEVAFIDHAVAQGTIAQSRIFGGAIGIAVSTIIMNNHMESALKDIVSPATLRALFISPFTILDYGFSVALDFRKSYIQAFKEDMRVAMFVSVAGLLLSLCSWQRHPPTVEERSLELARAVREYRFGKGEGEVVIGAEGIVTARDV